MRIISVFVLFVALSLYNVNAFLFPDCQNGPLAGSTICDESASVDMRARDLVSKLNLTERISRLVSTSIAIPRLGIPSYEWSNDALHGLRPGPGIIFATGDVPFNSSTAFPSPINFGATWSDENGRIAANIIGTEARAFANNNRAGLDLWAPNINPFRDPRWGRGQEVPSEDPLTVSRYGVAFVSGMQISEDPRYWLAAANCKHFAAYDVEHWHSADRNSYNAIISLRDLVEYYLPPFQACVSEGKSASIMCSYNAINGVPSCANSWLMQTLARDTWGLDPFGYITGDCNAINDVYVAHHFTQTPEETAAAALKAGAGTTHSYRQPRAIQNETILMERSYFVLVTDIDCGAFYTDHLYSAYSQSLVTDDDINRAVLRLTTTQIRLGFYDNPKTQIYRSYGVEHVNTPFAVNEARRIAEESFVLLKNNAQTLPLSLNKIKTVALIGPLINDTYYMQGNYRSVPRNPVTLYAGLQGVEEISVTSAFGCSVNGNDKSGFAAALALAKSADVTIFVGGNSEQVESEGSDRETIDWPGVQEDLIKQLETVANTFVVLITGGGQIDCTYEKGSSAVDALLWIGYPAQAAGTAVANTLFGMTAPAGRLPVTQYIADYVNQINMTDMGLRATDTTPGRTYKFYTGEPVYPFGYGLSYTTWSYVWGAPMVSTYSIESIVTRASVFGVPLPKSPFVSYVVNVTNTGAVTSDHAVLLFINSSVPDAPRAQLIDYTRIRRVAPGETRTIYFTPILSSIATVDIDGNKILEPSDYTLWIGNGREADLHHKFSIAGVATVIDKLPPPSVQQKVASS